MAAPERSLSTFLPRLEGALASRSAPALVFFAVLLSGYLYRIMVGYELFAREITPFSFIATRWSLLAGLRYLSWEVVFASLCALITWAATRLATRLVPSERHPLTRIAGWALVYGALLTGGFLTASHFGVVFEMHAGLTYDVVAEGWSTGNLRDYLAFASAGSVVLFLAPALVLGASQVLWLDGLRARAAVGLTLLSLVCVLPSPILFALDLDPSEPAWPLKAPPLVFLGRDLTERALAGESAHEAMTARLPPVDAPGIRPETAPFTRAEPLPGLTLPERADAPWNVLVVVMESVGANYIFDTRFTSGEVPMPFFQKLASEGIFFTRHYSTANTSPRSLFSIFSGLNPWPDVNMFCTRPNVKVPGLGDLLGDGHEKFLVTPGRLQSYFPRGFMQSMGFAELYGYYSLPESDRPSSGGGRNELDGADFFLARLERARAPFLAVYYSYAPHYYYWDHGSEYRVAPDLEDPYHQYLNNLRLLDRQIERVFTALRAQGRLDDTAVLLVGDHGEAFGQHPDNWKHSRHSFEENVRTPALLWQPRLFPAHRVESTTSHPDLLPTLLDALGVPYDVDQFQGDSLFRGLRHEGVFFYGNEDTLSSVGEDRQKVQVRFRDDVCVAYDLRADPDERTPLDCAARPEHRARLEGLLRYRRFQRRALPAHNERFAAR